MARTDEEKRKFYGSLCDLQIPQTIEFSPSARQVLYSTNLTWGHKKGKHSLSTLWLAETGKPGSSRQITSGLYNDCLPRWHPNGETIAFISDRAESGNKWDIYVLHLRNGDAEGEPYPVTPSDNAREISAFEFSPDGKTIAYLSADEKIADGQAREEDEEDWQVWGEYSSYVRLRLLDLSTKEVNLLTPAGSSTVLQKHIKSLCWSPDGLEIVTVSCRSPHVEEEFETGALISVLRVSNLQEITDICKLPSLPTDLVWARDGQLYFKSGTPTDKDCAGTCIYRISPSSGHSVQDPSQSLEKVAFGVENDVVHLTNVGGDVVASVQHGMSDCIYLVPDRLLFTEEKEIEAFAAAYTRDSDEIVLAIATSDINTPVEVYTMTASGGSLVKLSNHGAFLKDQHFGTCKFLSCQSLDNEVQLDNIFITPGRPTSASPNPFPTVVLIHGGPTMRMTNSFDAYHYFWVPYLLRLGYGILLPNYRGSSGKGEAFAFYSCRGQGKWDHDDVIAATQDAIQEGYIDKERIVVGGISQGGFLSYLASVRNGKHGFGWVFKAAIPVSGFSDTDSMSLVSDLGGTLEMELNAGRAPWKMPKNDIQNRQASALWEFHEAMERSKATGQMVVPPMLILHGERDERCPLTQAWGMRRALTSVGLPFEMVTYMKQPHLFVDRKHWINMMERIERWCEKYIGRGDQQYL